MPEVLPPAEREALDRGGRWGLRRDDEPDRKTSKKIVRLQNRVAMGEQQLEQKPVDGGEQVLDAMRSEIASLRAAEMAPA